MIIGNPFVANVDRTMSNEEVVQALRVDLAGELEAIIVYEAHAHATTDQRVKKVLQHIADEERTHVGELEQLIAILSPADAEKNQQGRQAVTALQQSNFQNQMQ
ncbi:MAG: demethoxyubiquinone hydroxylase family protein [Bacillota bacterium]